MNIRKLAALDMAIHGPRLIILEFAVGVAGPLALGILSLTRGRAPWQTALGWYLLALALNYVPLLMHALRIRTRDNAARAVRQELQDGTVRQYGLRSLLLLLPLVVPVMAVIQSLEER